MGIQKNKKGKINSEIYNSDQSETRKPKKRKAYLNTMEAYENSNYSSFNSSGFNNYDNAGSHNFGAGNGVGDAAGFTSDMNSLVNGMATMQTTVTQQEHVGGMAGMML